MAFAGVLCWSGEGLILEKQDRQQDFQFPVLILQLILWLWKIKLVHLSDA